MKFELADAVLQDEVDNGRFAGFNYAVLRHGEVVGRNCIGFADTQRQEAMRFDHLFRIFSCTKLITSCAALQLWEQGRFDFDDPVGEYIPALANLTVLASPDAPLDSARPAREPMRIRHVLTHTAGLTYPFLAPETPIAKAYGTSKTMNPATTITEQMDVLGTLPLLFEPGSAWHYSVATDVVGRLVEVLSGQSLDAYFAQHIFGPLGMKDTGFHVPAADHARIATHYVGDLADPSRPGLANADHLPFPGAYRSPMPRMNPGGGLVSSLDDFTRVIATMTAGGAPLLGPRAMEYVTNSQIPADMDIGFPGQPLLEGRGHSFAASVFRDATAQDPAARPGDVQWNGMSATQWTFSPGDGFGLVLMTQRYMGFGLPYWPKFKQAVRQQLG